MSFFSKKVISPNKVKFVSLLTVSGLVMVLVFVLTSVVMQQSLSNAENQYMRSCSHILDGYSSAVRFYLKNYRTSLSSIYDENLFRSEDTERIHRWLMDNKQFLDDDFISVFYVDKSFKGYFSQGFTKDLSGRDYLQEAFHLNSDYFVSDVLHSSVSDKMIFVIGEPVFDSSRKCIGILCASIDVRILERMRQVIRIGESSSVYIVDRTGRFLVHPDRNYIGKTFIPKSKKYQDITSITVAENGDDVVETEDENGVPINLFSTKIKNCSWTLAVAFPKSEFGRIYSQQNVDKALILLVSFMLLLFLVSLDFVVSNYFYKKQFVEIIYDPLTKLMTRSRFEKKVAMVMRHNPKKKFMLVSTDIKGFKFINQNYGEIAADRMVYYYSKILNNIVSDVHGLICHGYADNFYMFIKVESVFSAMRRFRTELKSMSTEIKNFDIPFFPKFGIVFLRPYDKKKYSVRELIGMASFAKTTVKDNVLVPFSIYNMRMLGKVNEQHYIETHMEAALKNGEFVVLYQPKVSLADDRIVGAEALVRWSTPDIGFLVPDKFIPLFERNGFITKLDFYVYEKVFQFLDKQIKAGLPVVPISVNMSRNHNKPDRFMSEFMGLFKKYNIPSTLIQVEILERSVMDNNTMREVTDCLHSAGFTVAMDDFGSGESSLNMLTKIPVDILKFDKDFLSSSTNENGCINEKSAKFIQSLIDMSKHLEKETIFEGVETKAQRDFLRSIKCDQVQGYFYSKPLDEENFIKFLSSHLPL